MTQPLAVLDASVLAGVLAGPGPAPEQRRLLRRYRLATPAHFDAEVLSALFGLARGGRLSDGRLRDSVDLLARFPARRIPLPRLLADAVSLRHNLSSYDALYLVLARRLQCPLITSDRRLAAAPRLSVELILVG